jgi:hypothetical protein
MLISLGFWLGCWIAPAPASPPIKDSAHLFSPEAVKQAEAAIQQFNQDYHKKLVIETFASPTTVKKWLLRLKDPPARSRFYQDWAIANAREAGPTSIYILICKEPAPLHVAVAAGGDAQKQAFPNSEWERLAGRIQGFFDTNQYDQGLTESIHFVRTTVARNGDLVPVPTSVFPWGGVSSFIFISLGLWLGMELVRKVQSQTNPDDYPPLARWSLGSGGSLVPAMLTPINFRWIHEVFRSLRPIRPANIPLPKVQEFHFHPDGIPDGDIDHRAGSQEYVHGEP